MLTGFTAVLVFAAAVYAFALILLMRAPEAGPQESPGSNAPALMK